jgi:hypothetical protein
VIAEEGLVFPLYTARKSDWVACRENLRRHHLSEPAAGAPRDRSFGAKTNDRARFRGNALALAGAARMRLEPNRILGLIEHHPGLRKATLSGRQIFENETLVFGGEICSHAHLAQHGFGFAR